MPSKLVVPKPSEWRDAILRVDRSALINRGVPNPNVTRGTDYWIRAESLAQQLSILSANQQVLVDQTLPDTAEDADLVRWLDIFRLQPSDAQGSTGSIVLPTSQATFIATGAQLIDGQGQAYEVSTGGTYSNGDLIPIDAIATGVATNHPQGTPLQWVGSPPTFADPVALVAVGGLIGGADSDTNESSRNRLFTFLRNPPQGGNWPQVAGWATESTASVQAGYVYPALNGPATLGLCVVGPLTFDVTNGWSRGVSDAVLATAAAFVRAKLPEHVDVVATTPKDTGGTTPNVDVDVAIGLSLPLSVAGGGPGGGWSDATAWPDLLGTATRVWASVVTDSTHITLTSDDATNCPSSLNLVVGQSRVCWFSSTQFAAGQDPVIVAVVTAVAGTTGALQVTLSVPFTGIAVGDFVFPNAENVQAYARAYMSAMNNQGPGQWSSNAQVLVRGKRRPLVTSSNPSDLTSTLLRTISDTGEEVLDIAYLYRSATGPGTPANTLTASPNVLVPRRFGLFDRIL